MTTDILVIGGGIVGLAAACHLKRLEPNLSVTLAERGARLCSGNSGRSAALYRNLFSSRAARRLAEGSIAQYRRIADAIVMKPIGYLWTFDADSWGALRPEAESLAGLALETELLEGNALRAASAMSAEPEGFAPAAGAILGRACGSLSAQALAAWYAARFTEAGGTVLTRSAVSGFSLDRDGSGSMFPSAAILADGSRIQAGSFLAATGAWTQDLLGPAGVASSVYPKKRQLFGFPVPDPAMLFGDAPGRPAIILPHGGIYLKPVPDKGLAVAGRADDLGRAFELPYAPVADRPAAEEPYFRERIEPALLAYFPALAAAHPGGLPLSQAWAGHYDYHWPDRNPVVERVGNLAWAAGSSGSGIMKGDAIGRIAAAAVLGHETAELADGSRFRVSDLSLRKRSVEPERLVI